MNQTEQIKSLKCDRRALIACLLITLAAAIFAGVRCDKAKRQADYWMNQALTIDARQP